MRRNTLRFETLESRDVPSTINWVNDGVNDHFGEVFGAQADEAREDVRAAISAWEQTISDFHNDNGNAIDLTIRMATDQDVTDYGFGGNTDRTAGQAPPNAITVDTQGKPISGLILLGRGSDGHGSGWYIDPTPDEAGEFLGQIENAFAGAASDPDAQAGLDFYTLTLAELTHAIGITSASGSLYRQTIDAGAAGLGGVKITDTGVLDKNYLGATGDKPTLWAFDGSSIDYLMTDADGGNKGQPAHSASPASGNSVLYKSQVLKGNWNIGNAGLLSAHRYLVSNAEALILQDVYGYSLASGGPERFGTFYTLRHDNGQVLIRGTSGKDTLDASRNALFTTAKADIAIPVPGTAPFDPLAGGFVSFYANTSVQAIRTEAGSGNDTIHFSGSFSGLDSVRAYGEAGNDRLDGSAATSGSLLLDGDDGKDTVYGGAGNDDLFGGSGNDLLRGYGGNDVIAAGTGNDNAQGGDGDDYILGDLGNDLLEGNNGVDTIYAGTGNDFVVGGSRLSSQVQNVPDDGDLLDGEAGKDLVIGDNAFGAGPTFFGGGNDTMLGGTENDTMYGGLGNDDMNGEDGSDRLFGLWGNDTIDGGDGVDFLYGADGNDSLQGGADGDHLNGDDGNDTLIGGFGIDLLHGGNDNDYLIGGTFFDTEFDSSRDYLYGEAGNDLLFGDNFALVSGDEGGDDWLEGGTGSDTLYGQAGNDNMFGGLDVDHLFGGDGNDGIVGGNNASGQAVLAEASGDELDGGDGDDRIIGDSGKAFPLFANSNLGGPDTVRGGGGNDLVYAMRGDDSIDGGAGEDVVFASLGNDSIDGGAGNDTLYGDDDTDTINGGDDDDLVYGNNGNDILAGDAGDDIIRGGNGRDFLTGGIGNDILLGEAGEDGLFGDDGRDVLIGGRDQDQLSGQLDDDLLVAGTTSFDGSNNALAKVQAEWTSTHTYDERVKNLSGKNNATFKERLNGNVFLRRGTTVFADGAVDNLNGGINDDWFFRDPADSSDAAATEVVL